MPVTLICPAPLVARGFSIRPEAVEDQEIFLEVFRAERWAQFTPLPLPDEQKSALLRSQFEWQRRHYLGSHDDAAFLSLVQGGTPIGRLCLATQGKTLLLVDIVLQADRRRQGISTFLLAGMIEQAAAAGYCVELHVDKTNPARSLYHRLGFRIIGDTEVAWRMTNAPIS